jgi:S-DNA-T family DNA segregation ATPase FtsK/SpoIIIE
MSLLFKASPDQMKLILIDPKRIEFSPFADLPHLLFPIQTQARSAILALQWAVRTMEERYEQMAREGVRNIHEFHAQFGQEALPFIVIVIDELADLMMTGGKDCEELITRLAQMARAAGMHLIAATQRPSVDVITGLIKVNFPARSAFKVASKIDSRTILDMSGAEKLLSKGDMLFLEPTGSLRRIQGAFISNKEIAAVVNAIKSQRKVEYLPLAVPTTDACALDDEDTELYEQVRTFVATIDEVSISLLQRRFRIGYNRSARIFDKLQSEGVIAASDGGKLRKVVKKTDANV